MGRIGRRLCAGNASAEKSDVVLGGPVRRRRPRPVSRILTAFVIQGVFVMMFSDPVPVLESFLTVGARGSYTGGGPCA
jgi:hypothetical protein